MSALPPESGHSRSDLGFWYAQGPSVIDERAAAVVGDAPAYLSFDIDALDPAFAPGTGSPEIGGLASWQMQGDPAPPREPAFCRHGCRRGGAAL